MRAIDGAWMHRITLPTHLIKEHVFAIASLRGEVFQHAVRSDSMLKAQLLPELHTNCISERGTGDGGKAMGRELEGLEF